MYSSESLRKFALFEDFTTSQLEMLLPFIKERRLDEGELLFREGDRGDTFFLVEKGAIEIRKYDPASKHEVFLATFSEGDTLGEIAPLAGTLRTGSARASQPTILLEMTLHELARSLPAELLSFFKTKISNLLISRVVNSNNIIAANYKKQLDLGNFTIQLVILLFSYIFTIELVTALKIHIVSTTIVSVPILGFFGVAILRMMKKSGAPWESYGFTLKNWKRAVGEAVLFSLPILVIIALLKWILIHSTSRFHDLPLFRIVAFFHGETSDMGHPVIAAILIGAYILFVPVQEIIYRGGIQGTFEKFLVSRHPTALAIFVSNIPFSMIHLHLSIPLAVLVYFFGLFWGWLYSRHRTLVGCILSHLLIGIGAFFIIGISDVLNNLVP